jgi:hypothetical protein
MPETSQILSAERHDSCHELEAMTPETPQMQDQLLVAIEMINHTFHLDDCLLPGTANEKMAGLKKWRIAKLGAWQLIAAYMLCKRPYIAIGTFVVGGFRSPSPLAWSLTLDIADDGCGSTGHRRNAAQTLCPE